MGQTLNHGVYLPAEGERNCYSGLASNWNLLDTAIGDIAGKASATHTHGNITNDGKVGTTANLPLITGTGGAVQAGAFGNQANTFCEGNDSRLSDARTPVAHTHTKSDVTDLLNSNFIPSANNSYDLGSSSYQWNNVYSKGYYYNGVAWGLDKDNTWTGANSFYKSIQIRGGRNAYIMPEFSASYSGLSFGTVEFKQSFKFGDWVDNNSTIGLNTSNAYVEIYAGLDSSDNINKVRLHPSPNATTAELGTATAKWKTLNGVNPGALSLPSGGTTENTDWFNVAGDILPTGGNATSFNKATANYFTPAKDGWLALAVKNCSELSVWCETLKYGISIVAPDASLNRQVVIPVVAGKSYQILIAGNSWTSARLIMPKGNV